MDLEGEFEEDVLVAEVAFLEAEEVSVFFFDMQGYESRFRTKFKRAGRYLSVVNLPSL